MTSSSRGGEDRSGGVRSQAASSSAPSEVIRNPFCGPSSALPSDSTSPSRSRRCSVVYTWPTFSGQTSPVPASNSSRSCKPYFGPSLSSASSACRTLMRPPNGHDAQYYTEYRVLSSRPFPALRAWFWWALTRTLPAVNARPGGQGALHEHALGQRPGGRRQQVNPGRQRHERGHHHGEIRQRARQGGGQGRGGTAPGGGCGGTAPAGGQRRGGTAPAGGQRRGGTAPGGLHRGAEVARQPGRQPADDGQQQEHASEHRALRAERAGPAQPVAAQRRAEQGVAEQSVRGAGDARRAEQQVHDAEHGPLRQGRQA